MTDFIYEKDADGIVTVTLDMHGQSANTMNERFVPGMDEVLTRLRAEPDLAGVVFASAKKTFFAGGDLRLILGIQKADAETLHYIEENKRPYRELEKLPVPVVAAINGAALGGGYELCLACNHRVIADIPGAVVGLPEVTLGLLPGAGGVVRLTKLLMNQTLTLSLFAFASPSDDDGYLRPKAIYKLSDSWTLEAGLNVFYGKAPHTFFGRFENNSNVYGSIRFSL